MKKAPLKLLIFCGVKASRGAGAQSVTVNATISGFDPHSKKGNIYLIKFNIKFPFLRFGVEAKHAVEFRHSTRNVSGIWKKIGKLSVLTLGALCLLCCVQDE